MAEPVEVTLARLEERISQLSDEVRHVHEEVSELKATANRWKGAFMGHVSAGWGSGYFRKLFSRVGKIMATARANMNNQVSKPPMKRPKSKMKAFNEFRKKNGRFHPADPRRPMNAESTNPKLPNETRGTDMSRHGQGSEGR